MKWYRNNFWFYKVWIPVIISPFIFIFSSSGQTIIKGKIIDEAGNAVVGANIYFFNTYDGTASGQDGSYQFITKLTGFGELVATAVGFRECHQTISLEKDTVVVLLTMEQDIRRLDDLVISAGMFEASDKKKSVALKPLDIVTTAGATADIPGVLNTLPGTQTVGEKGRLFVRGGESGETRTYIDGILADQAYSLSPDNIPSRMRFSPFLFSGTTFSTGGYSAEYGQALSGTLILNSDDLPLQSQTDLSIMSVGGALAHTWKWEQTALFMESSFTDLKPYFSLVPQHSQWILPPRSWQNTIMLNRNIPEKGRLKIFYANDFSKLQMKQTSVNDIIQTETIRLRNDFHYMNINYESGLNKNWKLFSGWSWTYSNSRANLERAGRNSMSSVFHGKFNASYDKGNWYDIRFGTDQYLFSNRLYKYNPTLNLPGNEILLDWIPAVFLESDIYFTGKLVGRIGLRSELASLTGRIKIDPRISLAYKTGNFSQISFASGIYNQRPEIDYLYVNPGLKDESAWHFILNYQIKQDNRTFRIESYYKKYGNLVRFNAIDQTFPVGYNNQGYGFARGIDIFWRDNQTLRNIDYWLSYSFLDTKRIYHDFPEASIPSFVSRHNFSLVYKQFVPEIKTQLGLTYTFASGRPYNDPNSNDFNDKLTPAYYDLSMNISYLLKSYFIIHFSATNLLGQDRIFGYQYETFPDKNGYYTGLPVEQEAKHFLFLGVFITLSKDNSVNQLRNL